MVSAETLCLGVLLLAFPLPGGQESPKSVRELAKGGADAIPQLQTLLADPAVEIRAEAVKALSSIGTQRSLAPLTAALKDADAEVQIRATDGLVSFYLPSYPQDSLSSTVKRGDKGVSGRFPEPDEQIVDPWVQVRPEIVQELRNLLKASPSGLVRANAARACGALRVRSAVPELIEGLRTKDDQVIYQSLLAIQKMRAREASPRYFFLIRDLDERIQSTAIETAGLLGDKAALPDLRRVLEAGPKTRVKRSVYSAMAMLPDPGYRDFYTTLLASDDEYARAAAGEGLGRIGNPEDRLKLEAAWSEEKKTPAELSIAFGLAALGHTETSEGSPLMVLHRHLGSRSWRGVAQPLLAELARRPEIRRNLIPLVDLGNRDQRVALIESLGTTGAADLTPTLERLARDPDARIASEASRALRHIRTAKQ